MKELLEPVHTSSLSPMTISWLNNIENVPLINPSLQKTATLLVETLSRIPGECVDQFIANELHAMLTTMIDKA